MKYCIYHHKTCDEANRSQSKRTKQLLISENGCISGGGIFKVEVNVAINRHKSWTPIPVLNA